MNRWIDCSKRLPEDGRRYPVLINEEILQIASRTMQDYWIDDQMGEIFPTHWMELPEPPMSDNEKLFYDKSLAYCCEGLIKILANVR